MRLLDSTTFELKEFVGCPGVEYVILSHTWGDNEITFQDLQSGKNVNDTSFAKIRNCCAQAVKDGFQYVWIDTCCIDKSSSSELSEAINSMYRWYGDAQICYAYLADVESTSDDIESDMKRSRWFTRGWTLQELIAPRIVEFYAADWVEIGTKLSRKALISEITGIDVQALLGKSMSMYSAAERMSWASERVATRTEDTAYSLMGLFNVNMPMLYGEGKRAFLRLQEEIMKETGDYTLFAWTIKSSTGYAGILARSPAAFKRLNLDPDGTSWSYSSLRFSTNLSALRPSITRSPGPLEPPRLSSKGVSIRLTTFRKETSATASLFALIYYHRRPDMAQAYIELEPVMFEVAQYRRKSLNKLFFVSISEFKKFQVYSGGYIYILGPRRTFPLRHPSGIHVRIMVAPQDESKLSISRTFYGRFANQDAGNYISLPSHSNGVILFWCKPNEYFWVGLGVVGLAVEVLSCCILTDIQVNADSSIEQKCYEQIESRLQATMTDRVSKRLQSGTVVAVSLRKARGSDSSVGRYTLHVALNPPRDSQLALLPGS